MKGGAPIASGSSGTVFKPVIDCKDKEGRISKEEKHKYISKVMYPHVFEEEKEIIKKLKPKITEIPNNNKYFIIDSIKLCENPIFSKDNLVSFNNQHSNGTYKFGSLKKKPVLTTNNLLVKDTFPYFGNKSTNKVKVLQIPYGGQDLYRFLRDNNNKLTNSDIIRLNIGVINLIKNGIKPMNDKGLVHTDLRIDNTVYDPETGLVKIIDWGLAYHKNFIISEDFFHIYVHPSENYPIYCLLFLDWFIELINKISTDKEDIISIGVNKIINFLFTQIDIKNLPKKLPKNIPNNIPRKIYDRSGKVINHLLDTYNYYGLTNDDLKNHIRSQLEIIIKNFFITTTSGPEDSENNSGSSKWVQYDTFNFSPDRRKIFRDTVYLKNIDLYTFISDYLSVLIIHSELNIFKSDLELKKVIKEKIKSIMLKYFFNPEEKYLTEGIDVEDLINDLKSINESLGHPKNSLNQPNPIKKNSQITNSYCTKAMKAAGFCVGAIGAATVGFLGTVALQAYVGGGTKKKKLVKKNKRKVSKKKNKSKTNKISKRNKKKCVKQANSKKKV
jgi:serine/threonine protein kinase